VAGIALLGKAVTELAKKMVESQRELAKFSPQLAGAFAESDIRDLTRKIESSQRTGQSTADLMEALSDFKDTIQPILDVIKVVISKVLTVLVKGFTTLVHVISLGLVTLKGVAGLLEDESKKKQRTLLEPERFLVDLAQGNFHKRRDPLFAFGG
jgi:predicted PurR-regulated permease PerM